MSNDNPTCLQKIPRHDLYGIDRTTPPEFQCHVVTRLYLMHFAALSFDDSDASNRHVPTLFARGGQAV